MEQVETGAAVRHQQENWDQLEHPADSGLTDDQEPEHDADHDGLGQWGLFGPRTVTWRVHSDPLIGLATLRGLAMQVLHPEGMANVFATARRVDDPWDRLQWSQRHMGAVIFGNSIEAAMTGARLRAVMGQVSGWASDGDEFRGDDEELVLWMHCCQVASFIEVTRRGGLDLTDAEHDAYIQEQVRTAAVWGLEPDQVPATRRDLARYFRRVRPQLRMTHEARAFISSLLSPAVPELIAMTQRNRPSWAPVAGLAWSSLPGWARSMYSSGPGDGAGSLTPSAATVALHSLRDALLVARH
ncbi:hypothetical protein GCM10022223_02120 [Kineosporia mesophila]|uniref:ER-bound oxygenase mpaB/mpaB'/Rubber oxygenase catalytic domain-containing protein n=1 Tax=Kineosporia mesophila TaxID=566012 RepID=A0ABP6YUR9_9ACTN|nr:oxygenase MpaB family protein [Kineosporia mesophila]MCD5351704.1 DUF2236 domain-containing protein [Kineosporia mesophila]